MSEMKFLELHGDRVAYQDVGSGPEALLLIHGMAGSSETWRAVIPQLSRKYRVVAPDLLGTRSVRQAPRRLFARRVRRLAARPARRAGDLDRNDHRPIAWWRRRHAVRLPTSGLLPAADPDQQRRAGPRRRLDAAPAVGPWRRADPAGHCAATGSDSRQQAALVVRSGRDSVTPGCGDVERLLIAVRCGDAPGVPTDAAIGGRPPRAGRQRTEPAAYGR